MNAEMNAEHDDGTKLEARSFSLPSRQKLDNLATLDTRVRRAEDAVRLAENEKSIEPLRAKAELAQLVGTLDKLEGEIDGVTTMDIASGRNSARHYRKALHARLEAIRDHATELYTALDQQILLMSHTKKETLTNMEEDNAAEEQEENKIVNDDEENESLNKIEEEADDEENESLNKIEEEADDDDDDDDDDDEKEMNCDDDSEGDEKEDEKQEESENEKVKTLPLQAKTDDNNSIKINFFNQERQSPTKKFSPDTNDVDELRRRLAELENENAHLLLREQKARQAQRAAAVSERQQKQKYTQPQTQRRHHLLPQYEPYHAVPRHQASTYRILFTRHLPSASSNLPE